MRLGGEKEKKQKLESKKNSEATKNHITMKKEGKNKNKTNRENVVKYERHSKRQDLEAKC